ncbi:MAG: hypothetical protein R3E18_08830 [Sphingomonadaceae bacterium]
MAGLDGSRASAASNIKKREEIFAIMRAEIGEDERQSKTSCNCGQAPISPRVIFPYGAAP